MRRIFFLLLMIALIMLASPATRADAGAKIAVLVSYQDTPFAEALTGFQDHLRDQGVQSDYEVYSLQGDAAQAREAVQKIKKSGVRLIFTLGSLATDAVISEITDIPVVACLIVRTERLKGAPNAAGVGLEFPLDVQFKWLLRFLPEVKTVGVLYSPSENQKRIESAAGIAKGLGLRLEAQEVRSVQDVPAALNRLSKRADVLWGLADTVAMPRQMAKSVIEFSFLNKIPLVGLSTTWVKAGALYSLEWDYADIGAQCGEAAQKVLGGISPGEIAQVSPRKVLYSVNLSTARQMKITISEGLIRGAQHTY